ncbi:MBL fold metallo-hydrolase [Granulicella sp. dw_53]|uniref:MBL fold metallo-hydrolase n=1 Tax=Granulicella sp. dw_53 TaxID=2719792 RepID=UPI001BD5F922|nr:MBL fold metallo-hydrolase [Granulicella sp. dw_53]
MNIERFEIPGLAQYSYIVSTRGLAVVVDPIRDIDRYLDYAQQHSLIITHILETHIHADYASGATALAAASGAELYLSAHDTNELFEYAFPHHPFGDGESFSVGDIRVQAVHTPGHTPEHLSFLLFDTTRSATLPASLFSGDFLFVGSLGRPDLLGEAAKQQLAQELYTSLKQRILTLPDSLEVLPGHGSGSLCGAGMSDRQQSTLGYERNVNPFFHLSADTFTQQILTTVPPFPTYYPRMKALNAAGAPILSALPGDTSIPFAQLQQLIATQPITLLDLRRPESFGGAHIPNSINIGAGQNLSLWAGWLLDPNHPIVLIDETGSNSQAFAEARRSLIRVGLDNILGYVSGGIAGWIDSSLPLSQIPQVAPSQLLALTQAATRGIILDVRSDTEWNNGHIVNARHIPLGDLTQHLNELQPQQTIYTVCGSGYRSSIAASLLAAQGFTSVSNMAGGMSAWNHQQLPVTKS